MASATDIANNTVIKVDGVNVNQSPSVIAGDTVAVEVTFTALQNATNVVVRAEIEGDKVNVDEQQMLAGEYGVRAIPTLLVFHNGQVADQIVGARSKRDFKASLDSVVA